jgi:hypothetical protein
MASAGSEDQKGRTEEHAEHSRGAWPGTSDYWVGHMGLKRTCHTDKSQEARNAREAHDR